jgi:hypothetical protein
MAMFQEQTVRTRVDIEDFGWAPRGVELFVERESAATNEFPGYGSEPLVLSIAEPAASAISPASR